jgi:hypothetical protein
MAPTESATNLGKLCAPFFISSSNNIAQVCFYWQSLVGVQNIVQLNIPELSNSEFVSLRDCHQTALSVLDWW